ncbi:hypothetical protein DDE19_14835 [Micromonospora ureilytica]|uniref:Uncharacterized protein n=1 Tax=Micromonospora ureilytica TaxID=709868 RepID=A0A3N9XUK3_9ACTN|nr:hypothetical protein [Micromonospora ureilytica]RQX16530.1 hypothetical protein DDE19_14835 [Micromonospora ureilytica]
MRQAHLLAQLGQDPLGHTPLVQPLEVRVHRLCMISSRQVSMRFGIKLSYISMKNMELTRLLI